MQGKTRRVRYGLCGWLCLTTFLGLFACAEAGRDEIGRKGLSPELPPRPRESLDASLDGLHDGSATGWGSATDSAFEHEGSSREGGASHGGSVPIKDRDASDEVEAPGSSEEPVAYDASAAEASTATCDLFQDIWTLRQENLSNDPELGDACFSCVFYTECVRPSTLCNSGSACVERNCLCTSEVTGCRTDTYPENLCECVESCFEPGSDCVGQWHAHMECVNSSCAASCPAR